MLISCEGVVQMLDLDIHEVRVVSINDIRCTERQALQAFRKAHTQVGPFSMRLFPLILCCC